MKVLHDCIDGRLPWPLFLYGPAGVGKTCAALCLLDLAGGEYFTADNLSDCHNAAKFGKYEEKLAVRDGLWVSDPSGTKKWKPDALNFRIVKLVKPPLVVVDELGGRPGSVATPAHYEAVKYALDLREGKPLITISNLGGPELEAVYDGRIVSRIGAGTLHEMFGEDRRLT